MSEGGPATPGSGLAHRARTGIAFTGLSYAARATLELGTSVVLARLLQPADFGVVAVGQAFLQLSYVIGNLGMGTALVQARHLTQVDRYAASTVSTLTAMALALGCARLATPAAAIFAMPVLAAAIPILSLEMVLAGLSATPVALLRRELRYGAIAAVEIGAAASYAIVSIALAWSGHGIWSLVWTPLVSGVWTLLASHGMARYRPGVSFDRPAIRRLLAFGGALTLKNIFVHLARNADNLVVARFLGDRATGLYTRAFTLATMPQTRLVSLVYGVSFPVFCRVRDDRARFHAWYLKATSAVAVIVTPILLGLAVVAREFTVVVYGAEWSEMASCLSILCLAGLINSLHMLGGAAIEASGRLRYDVAAQSLYGIMIPLGALAFVQFGIEGVACAVLCSAAVFWVTKGLALGKAIGLPLRDYLRAPGPALAAGLVMGAVVLAVRRMTVLGLPDGALAAPSFRLAVLVAAGAVTYAVCMWTFGRRQVRILEEQFAAYRSGRTPAGSRGSVARATT